MNATDTRDDEIAHYIAAVEDALSDLPPHVRGELIGDLVDHLTEIAGEITMAVPLAARLGPPEGYAAELRSTLPSTADTSARLPQPAIAGIAAVGPMPPAAVDWRALADRLDRGIGESFDYRRATDMLYAMRPGWWVVRALVLVTGLSLWWLDGFRYVLDDLPGAMMMTGLALIAVIGSVRLGRKTSPAARFGGAVVNLVAAPVLALGLLHGMNVLYVF